MKTEIIRKTEELETAAKIIQRGGLAAVPTETVYGLAGNGLDAQAVHQIYEVKGRPEVKPLALMVPGKEEMDRYCDPVPPAARALAARFWPGPLSIVLKARENVPEIVRAGGPTVSLRCPDHPMTLALLRLADLPLAAPSANPSGQPSPKTAQEVLNYFDGRIDAVIDGGPCGLGRESTIIDMSTAPYRILRQGALPEEKIAHALAEELQLVGITGPTGCGKTTALQVLSERGALILDCDRVYHELLERNQGLLDELNEAFPGTVEDGKLRREKLSVIVFREPKALERLNAISHHHVLEEVQRRLEAFAMAGGKLAAIDAIELLSSGLGERCAFTLAVLADPELRIRRIMARDGIDRQAAELRVKAQKPDAYYRKNCSYTLENNGDMDLFIQNLNHILEEQLKNERHEKRTVL